MHLLLTNMRHCIYLANTRTYPWFPGQVVDESEIGIFKTSTGKLERLSKLDLMSWLHVAHKRHWCK